MTDKELDEKAKNYALSHDTEIQGFEENLDCTNFVQKAYKDGFKAGQNELRRIVQEHFSKENLQNDDLWRACGLRLVGWDYESNKLDEDFECMAKLAKPFLPK